MDEESKLGDNIKKSQKEIEMLMKGLADVESLLTEVKYYCSLTIPAMFCWLRQLRRIRQRRLEEMRGLNLVIFSEHLLAILD